MALTTQYVKLKIDGTIYCIKDFPDIDINGNPDQVEATTLCDDYHEFVEGLKNFAEDLEFTTNYDKTKFNTLNGFGSTQKAVDILICSDSADTTGANGKFSIANALISVRLGGAGVGDILEMTIVVKPKSAITYTA